MTARDDLYDYMTVAFKETGVPDVVHEHVMKLLAKRDAEVLVQAANGLLAEVREWQAEPRWRDAKGDTRGPGVLHAEGRLRHRAEAINRRECPDCGCSDPDCATCRSRTCFQQ